MPALSASDAERLLRFLAHAENIDGDQPFTPELLVDLGRLIEADWVLYHETDYVRRRVLLSVPRLGEEDEEEDEHELTDDDWEQMNDHPICRLWWKEGSFRAVRLSEAVSLREYRRTRFYAERRKPWGVEYELKLRLRSPLWHGKTFAFYRTGRRDFTSRDRLMLELLTPHFSHLWHAARTRRLLSQAVAELAHVDEQGSRGVIFVGAGGDVEFMSPPAHRLLRDFFPRVSGGRLPAGVVDWLDGDTSRPLIRKRGGRRLVVQRTADSLVLEEHVEEMPLTAREREVLAWVARGKTNAEIAELLWLAPSTVRKHLENVYAKLGVSTRTAAAARLLGVIGADAS